MFDASAARKIVRKLERIRVDSPVPPQEPSPVSPASSPWGSTFGGSGALAADMEDCDTSTPMALSTHVIPSGRAAPRASVVVEEPDDDEDNEEELAHVLNLRAGSYYRHLLVSEPRSDERYARSLARLASPSSPHAANSLAMIVYKPPPVMPPADTGPRVELVDISDQVSNAQSSTTAARVSEPDDMEDMDL